jgi:hypothetical protein
MFKTLMFHWPIFLDSFLHPSFLTSKVKLNTLKDNVWFGQIPIGKNILCLLNKCLIEDILEFKSKNITNKIGNGIVMTKMIMLGPY